MIATTDEMLERVGGNSRLLREVIGLFIEECPRMIGRIRRALEDRNLTALNSAAHTFKGSAANFGADEVVSLAQRLETDAAKGNFPTLTMTLVRLEAEAGYMLANLSASEKVARCES